MSFKKSVAENKLVIIVGLITVVVTAILLIGRDFILEKIHERS